MQWNIVLYPVLNLAIHKTQQKQKYVIECSQKNE
jgi:hypothetical protein